MYIIDIQNRVNCIYEQKCFVMISFSADQSWFLHSSALYHLCDSIHLLCDETFSTMYSPLSLVMYHKHITYLYNLGYKILTRLLWDDVTLMEGHSHG